MAVDAVGDHAALWDRLSSRSTYVTQAFIELARAHDHFLHGRWEESLALARRGAAASAAHGYGYNEMMFLLHHGQVLAGRGDTAGLEAIARLLTPWAADRHLRLVTGRLLGLKALCALGHGRAAEAWHHVRSLTPPGGPLPRLPWIQLTLLDFAQAAVETGHRVEAQAHLRAVREAGIAAVSPTTPSWWPRPRPWRRPTTRPRNGTRPPTPCPEPRSGPSNWPDSTSPTAPACDAAPAAGRAPPD